MKPDQTGGQAQPRGQTWTSSLPQIASEDIIDIGNGCYAHFRRDRRFAQVQVAFTAPESMDPNPGRELIDQFKEQGWIWRPHEPGKPWIYQLEQSSPDDPTARGDSRDALHEQFLLIIQEYREKHGLPPILGWHSLTESEAKPQDAAPPAFLSHSEVDEAVRIGESQKLPSEKTETRAGGSALGMLGAFASVGAQRFDLTLTDREGEKIAFRGSLSLGPLQSEMPDILREAAQHMHNVIVRPRADGATLIQLDDLGEDAAIKLRPVSFLILRTSPGNYQAWVAVADADADFARRLRKGTGADLMASGATRVSGSSNFKQAYAPAFPCVERVHTSPGKMVTRADLEVLGMVAQPDKPAPMVFPSTSRRPDTRRWPSYQRCVENAPPARSGNHPDISRADYTFCLLAIDWGWSIEESAARLMQESSKALENGEVYALRTARAAARAIQGRAGKER